MNFLRLVRVHLKLNLTNRGAIFGGILIPIILYFFLSQIMTNEVEGFSFSQFLLPGVIGISLCSTAFVALPALVTALQEQDIMKRINATPYKTYKFITVIIIAQILTMLTQTIILVVVGKLFFGVTFSTNLSVWILSFIVFMLGLFSILTLGMMLVYFVKTSQNALTVGNGLNLVLVFISGGFYPKSMMPDWVQLIGNFTPVQYLLNGMRAVFNSTGARTYDVLISNLWKDAGYLIIFTLIFYIITTFTWKQTNK